MSTPQATDQLARLVHSVRVYDLSSLEPGYAVHVTTDNGVHFWLTRNDQPKTSKDVAWGFAVMHDGAGRGLPNVCAAPQRIAVTRELKRGETLTIWVNRHLLLTSGTIRNIQVTRG